MTWFITTWKRFKFSYRGKLTTFYSIRRKLSTFGIIHLLPYCINFAPSIRTQTSNYYL